MIAARQIIPMYRCPGEVHEISRPVHLARLASGYPLCLECPHCEAADGSRPPASSEVSAAVAPPPRRSLFVPTGVRGVYLNELDRHRAGLLAGAFASCLWEEWGSVGEGGQPPEARGSTAPAAGTQSGEGVTLLPTGQPGPVVVLGQDERPAAPDLVVGVGLALRRMGCQVIDLGTVTRPELWFGIDHLQAFGGVHVTGSGCDPSWIGLDFVRHGVIPCARGGSLDRIQQRFELGFARPTRRPGSQRLVSIHEPFEAGLLRHFHALRPLRVVVGTSLGSVRLRLERLFRRTACRLIPVDLPLRARRLNAPDDPDLMRVPRDVVEQRAHLGLLIDDDAQQCAVFDDQGNRVPAALLVQRLAESERDRDEGGVAVLEQRTMPISPGRMAESLPGGDVDEFPLSLEAMSIAMRQPGVACGGGESGRFWFTGPYPICDAVLTLVKLLHLLSRRDTPFAELLRNSG
ncbi:MAG: hypothetical protein ACKV0T_19960 [Planctomycetales bacterium]